MYAVSRLQHDQHGPVIQIEPAMNGSERTPFQAVQRASQERRLWMESEPRKVRIWVDGRVMTVQQAEHWANEEYQALPKCSFCANILEDDVITHQLSQQLFCSQKCADRDYNERVEKLEEEVEVEYL